MRLPALPETDSLKAGTSAFTLPEALVSLLIMVIVFDTVISAYMQSAYRAEWAGYSLAAQSAAIQQLEAAKSAVWDTQDTPVKDEISQLPTTTTTLLSLPVSGTNYVYATNYTTITLFTNSALTGASNYMVTVSTVWPFMWRNQTAYYTNTIACYYAPD
jgi:type II secretory pathway pseudopilin PulG